MRLRFGLDNQRKMKVRVKGEVLRRRRMLRLEIGEWRRIFFLGWIGWRWLRILLGELGRGVCRGQENRGVVVVVRVALYCIRDGWDFYAERDVWRGSFLRVWPS